MVAFLTSINRAFVCLFARVQLALQKHVNGHFNATENQKDQKDRRSSDPPVPKKLRVNVNGKKLRYRRQPFSGRFAVRLLGFADAIVFTV